MLLNINPKLSVCGYCGSPSQLSALRKPGSRSSCRDIIMIITESERAVCTCAWRVPASAVFSVNLDTVTIDPGKLIPEQRVQSPGGRGRGRQLRRVHRSTSAGRSGLCWRESHLSSGKFRLLFLCAFVCWTVPFCVASQCVTWRAYISRIRFLQSRHNRPGLLSQTPSELS